jgi:hypothetical protein
LSVQEILDMLKNHPAKTATVARLRPATSAIRRSRPRNAHTGCAEEFMALHAIFGIVNSLVFIESAGGDGAESLRGVLDPIVHHLNPLGAGPAKHFPGLGDQIFVELVRKRD